MSHSDNSNTKGEKYLTISRWLAGISLVLIIVGVFAPLIFTKGSCKPQYDFTETGQIGDTIGGIMSPFVGIAGVFVTFIAFLMQVRANQIQSEQIKKSFNITLLENQLNDRNALQLLNIDISNTIHGIDVTAEEVTKYCDALNETRFSEIACKQISDKYLERYTTIDRNHLYSGIQEFVDNEHKDDLFRNTFAILDYYSSGIKQLFDVVYKPYTEDIMQLKEQIPASLDDFYNKMQNNCCQGTSRLIFTFATEINNNVINDGIINMPHLSKILSDKKYDTLFDEIPTSAEDIRVILKAMGTKEKIMIMELRNAIAQFKSGDYYDKLKQINIIISDALSKNTPEQIQERFAKII